MMNLSAWFVFAMVCSFASVRALAAAPTSSAGASGLSDPITLHVRDQPADVAFKMLGEKIGCDIHGRTPVMWDNVRNAPILTNFDQQPFWDIVQELCRQAGVMPIESGRRQMVLGQDPVSVWPAEPHMVSGPIRISVTNSDLGRRRFRPGPMARRNGPARNNPPRTGPPQVQLTLLSDPRIFSMYVTPLVIESIQAEDGKPVAVVKPWKFNAKFFDGRTMLTVNLDPAANARHLRLFKASASVLLVTRSVPVEISNMAAAKNLAKDIGPLKFSFTTTLTGGGARIVASSQHNSESAHWDQLAECIPNAFSPRLFDKNGREYKLNHSSGGHWGAGNVDATFEFGGVPTRAGLPGPPDKFTWEVPVDCAVVPISIEFKDLRLQ